MCFVFFFSSRRRHTRLQGDWSSDVCSSDLLRTTRAKGTLSQRVRRADPLSDDLRVSRLVTPNTKAAEVLHQRTAVGFSARPSFQFSDHIRREFVGAPMPCTFRSMRHTVDRRPVRDWTGAN